jgi:hypothetical protein
MHTYPQIMASRQQAKKESLKKGILPLGSG